MVQMYAKTEPQERVVGSLIERVTRIRASNTPFFGPKRSLLTTEALLVKDVLYMLQGFASEHFLWDTVEQRFSIKNGTHVSHLSMSSLYNLLASFMDAATNLRRVEIFVKRVAYESTGSWLKFRPRALPTLEAFANAVAMRLACLRKAALDKELEAVAGGAGTTVTLLSLLASMSRVFAGAEFLKNVLQKAVPLPELFLAPSSSGAEIASHILSSLYEQLDESCLLQDGEEEGYRTLLLLFVGTLRPLSTSLDAWLQEGTLSDPSGELFFYANISVPIEDARFWQQGYQMCHQVSRQPIGAFSCSLNTETGLSTLLLEGDSLMQNIEGQSGLVQRTMDQNKVGKSGEEEGIICPAFLRALAKDVVSAGKSLQLLQHIQREKTQEEDCGYSSRASGSSTSFPPTPFSPAIHGPWKKFPSEVVMGALSLPSTLKNLNSLQWSGERPQESEIASHRHSQVSLFEEFCNSLEKLLGYGMSKGCPVESALPEPQMSSGHFMGTFDEIKTRKQMFKDEGSMWRQERAVEVSQDGHQYTFQETEIFHQSDRHYMTVKNSVHVILDSSQSQTTKQPPRPAGVEMKLPNSAFGPHSSTSSGDAVTRDSNVDDENGAKASFENLRSAFIARCTLEKPEDDLRQIQLNLSGYSELQPLNDAELQETIFSGEEDVTDSILDMDGDLGMHEVSHHGDSEDVRVSKGGHKHGRKPGFVGTSYSEGQGCGNLLVLHMRENVRAMERLLPYPTELPSSCERKAISEIVAPHQENQVTAQLLDWLQRAEFDATPSPAVLVQECLISSIQRRVHTVSQQLLARLMGEWRLMEELALLRAIYLVSSGDLLQQFASVLFNKLDRGEPWDDFYELNTMLQESVRSSAHGMNMPALDSLVVTVGPQPSAPRSSLSPVLGGLSPLPLQITGRSPTSGIDTLDSLRFVYKVAWPLELIIDSNAIKQYNQVMTFLMKVKRAKHALDKACRWTWKNGGGDGAHNKQRLLLQQKLMHFVNTLHQYVMDRVLYSAWVELSEGMVAARSLDEVIACHDAYLISIQRQCLIAHDKLWTLIAARVKTVLGLALDYYSIQRTLCDGVAAPAITARCQLEIERVERQFDECMVFLLRVLSFRLNVGHFPHLADLVTRINYNYYYMTEDGQILTPIPDSQGQMARRPSRRN